MNPNVVIAYENYGDDQALERQVLAQVNAKVTCTYGDVDSPTAAAALHDADAVMVSLQRVTAALLDSMPRCRIVGRAGTGVDTIDIDAATARGVWVTNVPDYGVDEVSNHAIALLLAQARNIVTLVNTTRRGEWHSSGGKTLYRLKGQTLGVIGFGRIGQATAAKAIGLGLKVIAYDPYFNHEAGARLGVQTVDLDTLARMSDYITLHTPLLESTRRMVNAELLAKMKPTAYLVNTARGPVVDETALLEAVRAGKLAGAALDVFHDEPLPAGSPLLHEDRILLTPHSAWYSEEAKRDMRARCVEDVVRVLKGEKPLRPVNQIG